MKLLPFCFFFFLFSCHAKNKDEKAPIKTSVTTLTSASASFDTSINTIHVFVALCDNKYQGIVPVPAAIGNGQDPDKNLYWGAGFGVKTYFKKSADWTFIKSIKNDSVRLERLIFKSKKGNYYLVADAYDGKFISNCTFDFLKSCSGAFKDVIDVNGKNIGIFGNSNLLAYIGHNGLMDFSLNEDFSNSDGKQRDAIVLACISKSYFAKPLSAAKAQPLLWTTGLMCPEAYSLHDALNVYMNKGKAELISNAAAAAYSKYQKCSLKAAKNLLVSGS